MLLVFFLSTLPGYCTELNMSAAQVDRFPERNLVVLTGNARVTTTELDIKAEIIRIFEKTKRIEAEHHVIATIRGNRIQGTRAVYDIPNESGTVFEGQLRLPDGIVFDASEIKTIGKDRFELTNASMTTCPDCCRHWTFNADRIRIRREGYAFFRNLSFRVGDRSWLYLPGFIYPAKTKRAFGLLIPEIGNSSKLGFKYRQDLFVPIGDSMDFTYTHDYYGTAGTGAGLEFRVARKPGEFGKFYLYSIHDKLVDDRRSLLQAEYRYNAPWGRIALHSFEGDDFNLVRDFTFHEYDLAMRHFHSGLSLDIARDRYRLVAGLDRQNILFRDGEFLFSQTPILYASLRAGHLFNREIRIHADGRYVDNPRISSDAFAKGSLIVNSTGSTRMGPFRLVDSFRVGYRAYGENPVLDDHRVVHGELKLMSPDLERVYGLTVHRLHAFASVGYHDTDTVFPEILNDSDDFVHPDGLAVAAGLETTLDWGDRTAVGGVYTAWNLSDNRYHNPIEPERTSDSSPIIGFLELPFEQFGLDLNVRYDPTLNTLDKAWITARLSDTGSLSYVRAFTYGEDRLRNSLIASLQTPLTEHWSMRFRADYDFSLDDFRYREITLRYWRDCIGFNLTYRNNAYSVNTNNEFTVTLVLRNIGDFISYKLGL